MMGRIRQNSNEKYKTKRGRKGKEREQQVMDEEVLAALHEVRSGEVGFEQVLSCCGGDLWCLESQSQWKGIQRTEAEGDWCLMVKRS